LVTLRAALKWAREAKWINDVPHIEVPAQPPPPARPVADARGSRSAIEVGTGFARPDVLGAGTLHGRPGGCCPRAHMGPSRPHQWVDRSGTGYRRQGARGGADR
jgi:hypothetical protein